MKILPKQIRAEFFQYSSPLPVDDLKNEIENVLTASKGASPSRIPSPKFIIDNEFEIKFRWDVIGYNSLMQPYSATSMKGFIFKNTKGQTQVNLLLSPNSFFPFLLVILPLLYYLLFIAVDAGYHNSYFYIISITVFFIASTVVLALSQFYKNRLKNRFVKYFNLSEIS